MVEQFYNSFTCALTLKNDTLNLCTSRSTSIPFYKGCLRNKICCYIQNYFAI